MSFTRIIPGLWMEIALEKKARLVEVFQLERTGGSEVHDNVLVSDGHTIKDLMGITKEKMEEYVGSTAEFSRLWELTLAKVHYELNPPIGVISVPDEEKPDIITNKVNTNENNKKSK